MNTTGILSARELGALYGVSGNKIKSWITEGKFASAHKVRGQGGQRWAIDINDPGVDPAIRDAWTRMVDRVVGPKPIGDEIKELTRAVEEQSRLLAEAVEILKGIKEHFIKAK
jgi:hypothetical protein